MKKPELKPLRFMGNYRETEKPFGKDYFVKLALKESKNNREGDLYAMRFLWGKK